MNVSSCGLILSLCCNDICGHGKSRRFEANADNLVGALARRSTAHLFPT